MAQKVGKVVKHYHKATGKPILKILAVDARGEIVAASVGRRKIEILAGLPYITCNSPLHQGRRMRPYTEFAVHHANRGIFFRAECKKCHNKQRGRTPYIPTYKVKPYLREIVETCGGMRPAAKVLGMPVSCIYRWLDSTGNLQTKNAALIINSLYKVRNK